MSSLAERDEKICLNCNRELYGKYCHACGQENVQPRRPIWEIPWHFITNIINVDGKFWSSVKYLLFRPGYLSKEYINGRRNSFHEPVRMYLVTSFILFFLSGFMFDSVSSVISDELQNDKKELMNNSDSNSTSFGSRKIYIGEIDSMGNKDVNITFGDDNVVEKTDTISKEELSEAIKKSENQIKDIISYLESNLSWILWISIPLFASGLKLIYIRRRIFFWDHLIFSLHFYSFMFLLVVVWFGFEKLDDLVDSNNIKAIVDYTTSIILISGGVYLLVGMKRFYSQGWIKTVIKFILLNIILVFLFLIETIILTLIYGKDVNI